MIVTLKPFGMIDPAVLDHLKRALGAFGEVTVAPGVTVPASFEHRVVDGSVQYQASEFEKACTNEPGDRVLAVTDVDLFARGQTFVFGHAKIRDRYAVVSLARFGDDGPDKLLDRAAKTAIHELGHTMGLYHDDRNPGCVMHFSEKLEDTDRKGPTFCSRCNLTFVFTLSQR